tara:strand:- start:295 stop:546 length:252 start_codon:yes stop_codon:yes gene_type:complete
MGTGATITAGGHLENATWATVVARTVTALSSALVSRIDSRTELNRVTAVEGVRQGAPSHGCRGQPGAKKSHLKELYCSVETEG